MLLVLHQTPRPDPQILQAYTALLTAAVKGGESDLAVEVYRQMGAEGMARDRQVFAVLVDVHVRQGAMREALEVRSPEVLLQGRACPGGEHVGSAVEAEMCCKQGSCRVHHGLGSDRGQGTDARRLCN